MTEHLTHLTAQLREMRERRQELLDTTTSNGQDSDPFWLGRLSMSAALAFRTDDHLESRRVLKSTLDDFLRSPLPSGELAKMLREEMKR